MANKTVTAILQKEMDRKEFLQHVGIAFLAMTGVSGMLKSVANHNVGTTTQKAQAGYGAMPYGGAKK